LAIVGAIRWVGKGFKLTGDLLTAEGVDDWIKEKGDIAVQNTIKHLALRQIRGRARAERVVTRDVLGQVNNEYVRDAISKRIENWPTFLVTYAAGIPENSLLSPQRSFYSTRLVVAPRAPVRRAFEEWMGKELKDSALLRDALGQSYEGAAEFLLRRVARETEDSFAEMKPSERPLLLVPLIGYKYVVLVDYDRGVDWPNESLRGQYWLTLNSNKPDLSSSRARNKYAEAIEGLIKEEKVSLGEAGAEDIASAYSGCLAAAADLR
jgi:hypothetical protein